ncbi:hypothetical protein DPMN_034705 [Dreissena polymorpha]|uniref:GH18 domain-containing protein n=1 Tax=Dreissena polymorpha TaxID=45954 RepID=A0A9D4RM89_DREPO|nr:hypothetical protein DPMN_034705 [Dreissena polymorpha]
MTLTGATRQYFINSTLHFLRQHNFDGIDIDWEYPARRGGRPEDRNNLALLLSVRIRFLVDMGAVNMKLIFYISCIFVFFNGC